ncbi:amino acid/amide ABC transporter ATP-binding protein 1 (HAAT family) [Shimia isoporae]|uniref:Amino acid/amide ABC transporter ATP-binding protein 1 (HAAT family) n=1 Tax=Shimia isoporae TaxID=647720 RepID=A0A4V6NFS9_9RHOB|nr:ABC transporter ATP-binding protein [Shimia isoporae]TCL09490.1 amino acid/amide ABC transporter ATP-binding protein 1 (HAAT family) [Shimia isoporae]
MSILRTENLSKEFDGLVSVDDVSIEIPNGQIRALIGPNGAGKTTFVSMLCGRLKATSGRVIFDSCNVSDWPAHRRIATGMGYTFQITSIFPDMTVQQAVALAARRNAKDKRCAVRRVANVLQRVGLADLRDITAGDLSYGHQRLLELAMGIVQQPKLLILDEPTQGLSDDEIENFKSLIRDIAGDTTVLLIEHNMSVVMELADFITVMDAGRVLFEGVPQAVKEDAGVQKAYLGAAYVAA